MAPLKAEPPIQLLVSVIHNFHFAMKRLTVKQAALGMLGCLMVYRIQFHMMNGIVDHDDIILPNNDQQQQQRSLLRQSPAAPTRSRIMEADVMTQLRQAYTAVENLIQPPLGEGTSREDPTLQPLSKDYRGLDMALPANDQLRSNRILYLITPTYKRRTQMVDLTRLSQTLRLAVEAGYHRRLYWILLEDATAPTHRVRQFALESGIPFAHKAVKTPEWIKKKPKKKPKAHRGIEQRNAGLDIVEQVGAEGVRRRLLHGR